MSCAEPEYYTKIYEETKKRWAHERRECKALELGFRILYSPPCDSPKLLLIGLQPGRDEKRKDRDKAQQQMDGWPAENEFATEDWCLAKRTRELVDVGALRASMAMDAIFFRSPNDDQWEKIPRETRKGLKEFCLERTKSIIDRAKPSLIMAIGLGTFSMLTKEQGKLELPNNRQNRRLVVSGSVQGFPLIGIRHPTGKQALSSEDWNSMTNNLPKILKRFYNK